MKSPGYFPVLSILATILLITGCIKTDEVDDNMKQTFSIPMGEKSLKIDAPTIYDTDTLNYFYYNGRRFEIIGTIFKKEEMLEFEMDSMNKNDVIKGTDFKIRFQNSFPVNANLQIYILNIAKQITDSFFVTGLQKIPAGELNSKNEPDIITTTLLNADFHGERFDRLKNAKFLKYIFYLETKREDNATLRIHMDCDMKINLAMRLYLQYNLNEL